MNQSLLLINMPADTAASISKVFPFAETISTDAYNCYQRLLTVKPEDTVIITDDSEDTTPFFTWMDVIFKFSNHQEIPHIVYIAFHIDRRFYAMWNDPRHPKIFLGTQGYCRRVQDYLLAKEHCNSISAESLWVNEVELLLAAFRLSESYEGYPILRELLVRSFNQFTPALSVYEDMLGILVVEYGTSIANAERSLRHLLHILWHSPYRREWATALEAPFWGSYRKRPTLTEFYRACFYYLRRRIEQITLQ